MNGFGGGVSTGFRKQNLPTAPLLPGMLSIGGTGFGRVTYSGGGRLGVTSCVSTTWVAETQVTCGGARGVVEANTSAAVLLTVAWRWNTLLLGFSYDGPAVSMVLQSNRAKVGGIVTVSGINFGGSDYTPRAAIGFTAAQSTEWTSDSTLLAQSSGGAGETLQVSVTLGGGNETLLPLGPGRQGFSGPVFSFDAPSILGGVLNIGPLRPGCNGPTATSLNVSAEAFNMTAAGLGGVDLSCLSRLGGSASASTTWISDTSVSAQPAIQSSGRFLSALVTIALSKGSGSNIYSFDAPLVENASMIVRGGDPTPNPTAVMNVAPSPEQREALALSGSGFGTIQTSASVRTGVTACSSTLWTSSSSVIARIAGLLEGAAVLTATVSFNFGTRAELMIDAPSVSTVTNKKLYMGYSQWESNAGRSGGRNISILGTSMGFYSSSPTTRIAATACAATTWTSESHLICRVASGRGELLAIAATVGVRKGTRSVVFSYDSPAVSVVTPANGPSRALTVLTFIQGFGEVAKPWVLTLSGANFHVVDPSPSIRVGQTTCSSTLWSSDSSIMCTLSAGFSYAMEGTKSGGHLVLISFAGPNATTTSVTRAFTYDAPSVTSIVPPQSNSSQEGKFAFTVLGSSFGAWSPASSSMEAGGNTTKCASARLLSLVIGPSACDASSWTSDSSAACLSAPAGVGRAEVAVQRCNRTSWRFNSSSSSPTAAPSLFCYDAASLTPVMCTITNFSNISVTISNASVPNSSVTYTFTTSSSRTQRCGPIYGRSNGPPSGGGAVTLIGTNFGPWDTSVQGRFGDTAAVTLGWLSSSAVVCLTRPAAPGTAATVILSVASSKTSALASFSFDTAVVTAVFPSNLPPRGGGVTLLGKNFGVLPNVSASASLGDTLCSSALWMSDSSLLCSSGVAAPGVSRVTLHGPYLASEGSEAVMLLSFDAPVLRMVLPSSGNMIGGSQVTIVGANFGRVDASLSVFVGLSSCVAQTWTSDSSIACVLSAASSSGFVGTLIVMPPDSSGAQAPGLGGGGGGGGGGEERLPDGDAYLNNSFSYVYVETSAPQEVFSTPVNAPPASKNMVYTEKDCSDGQPLSTNAATCDALLPDGQGISIPPSVWPATVRAPVSVTLVSEAKSMAMMTDAALQGAIPISNVLHLQPTGTRFTLGEHENIKICEYT